MQVLRVQHAGWLRGGESSVVATVRKAVSVLLRVVSGQKVAGESRLAIDEKISLGPKKSLFLVRCDGRQFLVATGAETVASPVEVSTKSRRGRIAQEGRE